MGRAFSYPVSGGRAVRLESMHELNGLKAGEQAQRKPSVPPVTLVKCRVFESQITEVGMGERIVLFRHSAQGQMQRHYQVEEGVEVHVWRPWASLDTPAHQSSATEMDVGIPLTEREAVWMFSRYFVLHTQPSVG